MFAEIVEVAVSEALIARRALMLAETVEVEAIVGANGFAGPSPKVAVTAEVALTTA